MKTTRTPEMKEIGWPARTFLIERAHVEFDQLKSFFTKSYHELYGAAEKLGLQADEPPCAIYFSIDEARKETDVAAAVPVKGKMRDTEDLDIFTLPASSVLTTTHYGGYESMTATYEALEKYLADHALERELIIEEYLSDPAVEKDPGKWKTNIYFVLK